MSKTYDVLPGIEIPPVQRTGRRGSKYPFATMPVGSMFFNPRRRSAQVVQLAAQRRAAPAGLQVRVTDGDAGRP